jgi:hypothetical protein
MWIVKNWTISAVLITLCLSLGATFSQGADVCNNRDQFVTRPIPLGLCGNNTRTECNGKLVQGTLGALVTKNSTYFILGASHVLAVSNGGVVGDPIVQPSGAPVADKVAKLSSFTTLSTTNNSHFGVSIVGKTCTTLATASDGGLLPQEDLQPTQEQLQADDVARTLGPELLKIPGVWGDESTDDENGHMIIKVMVDAITPELLQAVPSTLGGFPVRIYQMEREVMLGDSMCGSGKKHGTAR